MTNLHLAGIPALQRATLAAIRKAVNEVGARYGFEVSLAEFFDRNRRIEVGVKVVAAPLIEAGQKGHIIGIKIDSETMDEIAADFADSFDVWADIKIRQSAA